MSVYLVFLVNIQFNVASIKKVFSSSIFQRCLLLRTSPAGIWTGKGFFSGKWDQWMVMGRDLRHLPSLRSWAYRRGSFLWCTCAGFSISPVLCATSSSPWPVVCYLGLWSRRENGIFGYLKWTAVPALTGPGFEPQLSDLLWWSAGSRMAGQRLWRWITCMQE